MPDPNEEKGHAAVRALLEQYDDVITEYARDALEEDVSPEDFVVLCIADRPDWRPINSYLENDCCFGLYDDEGKVPAYIGCMLVSNVIAAFQPHLPLVVEALKTPDPSGRVRIVIVDDDDAGVVLKTMQPDRTAN
ncbi:MAG: hypothetical protein RLZZ324_722 [Candidatus Parcubacteria bacterium]